MHWIAITFEVSKLIKFSPKRDVMFEKLKDTIAPDTPGFRVLCPTRWTVRANSLKSVLDNYIVLQELWEQAKDEVSDPSIKSRIIGVQTQFKTFQYFYGVILGELILKHSDNLSKTLQSPKLSASEGQHVAEMTVRTRPQSNMLKNLPKMLLGISQKFPLLCLDFFLLCSIMLTIIIAVRYVYTHNLYN